MNIRPSSSWIHNILVFIGGVGGAQNKGGSIAGDVWVADPSQTRFGTGPERDRTALRGPAPPRRS
jgi:hypothetical protein